MKLATLTLGCKVNSYDTEAMEEIFLNNGYSIVNFSEEADVYLINTCTVTNLSDRKSRQMIRRAKRNNPNSIIIATGCYAQVSPEDVSKIEEVNLIIGTKDRNKILEKIEEYKNSNKNQLNYVSNIMEEKDFERLFITGLKNKTRAYLKIQEGCNRYCSYCIIPYARGTIRSRTEEDILKEVKTLVSNGFKEFVLTGIHVASYGLDLKNINLIEIIEKVHQIDGVERIRFSSIEPTIITEDFVNRLKVLPKICDHMHLSLQSGSNKTLKNMNRKYTKEQYKTAVDLLRKNFQNISITTDIIVGFPGETEEDFLESYNFSKEMQLSKIHVFPFSPKKGTVAEKMTGQIEATIKNKRVQKFLALDEELQKNFLENNLYKIKRVLFEGKNADKIYEGYTSNYILVKIFSEKNIVNNILDVKLNSIENFNVRGIL